MSAEWFEEKEVVDTAKLERAERAARDAEQAYKKATLDSSRPIEQAKKRCREAILHELEGYEESIGQLINVEGLSNIIYDVVLEIAQDEIADLLAAWNNAALDVDNLRHNWLSAKKRLDQAKIECRLPSR